MCKTRLQINRTKFCGKKQLEGGRYLCGARLEQYLTHTRHLRSIRSTTMTLLTLSGNAKKSAFRKVFSAIEYSSADPTTIPKHNIAHRRASNTERFSCKKGSLNRKVSISYYFRDLLQFSSLKNKILGNGISGFRIGLRNTGIQGTSNESFG